MQKQEGYSCPYLHLSMQWKHNTILTTLFVYIYLRTGMYALSKMIGLQAHI